MPETAPDDKVECAIVIVTHNSARYIDSLLDSLPAATDGLSSRVVLVDNGSTDGTVGVVKRRPRINCVEAGGNLGYAGGINLGRSRAGDYAALAVLNPDLVLGAGALRHLFAALVEQQVGIAVPRLLNEDGTLYPSLRREPTLLRAMGEGLFGHHFGSRPGFLGESIYQPDAYEKGHPVDWAGGAAWMISAACDRAVGDWDERFFLYMEEVDFARRAREARFPIQYVPQAEVRHHGGGSGQSAALAALMAVNRVRYYRKHHGTVAAAPYWLVVVMHHALRSTSPEARFVLRNLVSRGARQELPHGDFVPKKQVMV